MKEDPGIGTGGKGIFQTPFGINQGIPNNPVGGSANAPLAKTFDYGNATKDFRDIEYNEKGQGIIEGPGTATGNQKR